MLVPTLADVRRGVGCRAVAPGKEEGCTFDREKTLTDELVDLVFGDHRVVAEVGHHLGPAAGAEARRRGALRGGQSAQSHAA